MNKRKLAAENRRLMQLNIRQLRNEQARLEKEVADLDADRALRLMLRGIHQDVDAIKILLRALLAPRDELIKRLDPDANETRSETHGEFVDPKDLGK